MKKFFKFLLYLSAAAAAIGGVLYFLKNILMKDNDLYDEETEDRDYVTITPDSETGDGDADNPSDGDDAETEIEPEMEE